MRRLSVTAAGLALAIGAGLVGCDNGESGGAAARTPCGSHGQWDDGATETERFTRDDRGRLVEAETRDAAGALMRRQVWTWDGKHLRSTEVVDGSARSRTEYDYEFDRLLRITRDDGAGGGFVTTYGYAGDAMVTQDVEYRDPRREHRHATITGDLAERTTVVDCAVTAPPRCQTWIFEQPDHVGEHWTRATVDLTSDGAIDLRYTRTLDARGLELTFFEAAIDADGAATELVREATARDADGLALGYVREVLDGASPRVFRLDDDFTCAAERPAQAERPDRANAAPGLKRVSLDDASLGPRRLRRDPTGSPRSQDLAPRRICALSLLGLAAAMP